MSRLRNPLMSRRSLLEFSITAAAGTALLAACQPQTIEVTKVVEKPVEKIVEKKVETTKIVEKSVEVTKVVEKQVVVTQAPKPRERVEIILDSDWLAGGARGKVVQQALELWHKGNKPRIIGRVEDGCDHTKKVTTDTMGDVTLSCGNTLLYWGEQGIWQDITDSLKARNYDFSDFVKHENFYTFQGKYIGLPFQWQSGDWTLNKTMLENAGGKVPDMIKWTWDDVLEVGRKVTKPEKNQWGTHWNNSTWHTAVRSFGCSDNLISKDGTKTLLSEGAAMDALQMIHDWTFKWKTQPTIKYVSDNKLSFAAGNFAFSIGNFRGLEFEAVELIPPLHSQTGKRFGVCNAQPHLISRWAKQRGVVEEAVDFVIFMSGKEVNQIIAAEPANALPNRLSVLNIHPALSAATRQVLVETNKYRSCLPYFHSKYFSAWWSVITPPLTKAFNGEISLKEAVAQAVEAGDKALKG